MSKDFEFTVDIVFLGSRRQLQLCVEDSDLVGDVKARLRELGHETVKLLFHGSALPDVRTLGSLGVGPTAEGVIPSLYCLEAGAETSEARVAKEDREKRVLQVVNLSGGSIHLSVKECDTVRLVKQSLSKTVSLPADHISLLYEGMELTDDIVLFDNAISSVFLLERESSGTSDAELPAVNLVPSEPNIAGGLLDRRIDGLWFRAKVQRMHVLNETCTVDIQYLDDGNVELGVELSECRFLNWPPD